MIDFTDIAGLAGSTLTIVAMITLLPGVSRLQKIPLSVLLCAIAIGVLIPFAGLPLAAYVRGVTGDLSLTSLLLMALVITRPLLGLTAGDGRERRGLLLLVAIAAVGLYPMALGLGLYDPYGLGYGSPCLLGGLLLLALTAYFRQLPLIALSIALAVFTWGVGSYESANLWDYLLDPLLAIYAISSLLKPGILTLLSMRRN